MDNIDNINDVKINITTIKNIISGKMCDDNANLQKNPETYHKQIADAISKEFYLKMLPTGLRNLHTSGIIHIHDLEYFGTRPFCRSHDIRPILKYGFRPDGGFGAINAGPAMHPEVAILQACKTLAMGQTQHAGGQGLLYGIVFLSPFMSEYNYDEIKQFMQMMIYELNQMYISRGGQVIFSSINITPGVPKILEDVPVVWKGKVWDGVNTEKKLTYKDFENEVRLMFKALMEISMAGDADGKPFPFPKLEVSLENKFLDKDTWEDGDPSYKDLYKLCFEVAAKFGSIYFDNLLIDGKNNDDKVSCTQCCAYQFASDKSSDSLFYEKLNFINDNHFSLGGEQVISLNLPRLSYIANHDDKRLMIEIYNMMDNAVKIFKIKRNMIYDQSKYESLRFINQKTPNGVRFTDWNNLVFEIGIVGFVEMLEHHLNMKIINDLGVNDAVLEFGKSILSQMRDYCKLLSEFNNMKIVLSRTPAETTAQKFAVCDLRSEYAGEAVKYIKGDLNTSLGLINSESNLPIYYSNGFAPDVDADIHDKLIIESEFWKYVDGGAITHIWLSEDDPNSDNLMDYTINLCRNSNIGYLTFTKDISKCFKCGKIMSGIKTKCDCGCEEIIIMSRITGYYSVAGIMVNGIFNRRWNAAKANELFRRKKVTI